MSNIYLAIPGTKFCWGTIVSLSNATREHKMVYGSSRHGYACNVDMNECWVEALNMQEAGLIKYFAMLHADIEIETNYWLDALVSILEEKQADFVSVHSPIKNFTGLTSTGICHPTYFFGSFRRFTVAEIKNLPETFNHQMAGYPHQPILHNTGCCICNISNPIFHSTNPDGTLKFLFRFIEQAFNKDGVWKRTQESEDWHFSRLMWENGIKNTWVTSKIDLIHYGEAGFSNQDTRGTYKNGDEESAHVWRSSILAPLTRIAFELGSECNLGKIHTECPNMHPERYALLNTTQELNDKLVATTIVEAYTQFGFTGSISWIYYNEPLMQADRIFNIMKVVKHIVPSARFLLWTNGTLIPKDCEDYRLFSEIIVTEYDENSTRGVNRLRAHNIDVFVIENPKFDNRLYNLKIHSADEPCDIPFKELIIDNYGNGHICCYDWRGEVKLGNIFTDGFPHIIQQWHQLAGSISGDTMLETAPSLCKQCQHKQCANKALNPYIAERAENVKSVSFDEHGNESTNYPLRS